MVISDCKMGYVRWSIDVTYFPTVIYRKGAAEEETNFNGRYGCQNRNAGCK